MNDSIEIRPGLVVGFGEPDRERLRQLARRGFRAVIDLRETSEGLGALTPRDERAEAERMGMSHIHIPVPFDRLTAGMLDRFHRAVSSLRGPIFVHCSSGKRSGVFALAEAARDEGLSGQEALERAEAMGVAYGPAEVKDAFRRYVDEHHRAHRRSFLPALLPAARRRVRRATSGAVNARIDRGIERSVHYCAEHPDQINRRLKELDREWDIERALEANAATLALAGVALGATVDRRFLALPAVVTGFLLEHALQGWCPPVPIFRRLGYRTAAEIERERYALKAVRGDFVPVGEQIADPHERAATALDAVHA